MAFLPILGSVIGGLFGGGGGGGLFGGAASNGIAAAQLRSATANADAVAAETEFAGHEVTEYTTMSTAANAEMAMSKAQGESYMAGQQVEGSLFKAATQALQAG